MKGRLALVALLVGCAGGSPPPTAPSTRGDTPGATRASREAPEVIEPAVPALGPASYQTTPLGEREIEDGLGGRVVAEAIGVDLDPTRFPARALDPVLYVGTRRYAEYHYVAGVLRFAVQASVLAEGPLRVQYGDDLASRVELVPLAPGAGAVTP